MNRKIAFLLLTSSLLVTAVSCTDARTTSEAPAPNANYSTSSPTASPQNTQAAMADAQDETRKKQLDADILSPEKDKAEKDQPMEKFGYGAVPFAAVLELHGSLLLRGDESIDSVSIHPFSFSFN